MRPTSVVVSPSCTSVTISRKGRIDDLASHKGRTVRQAIRSAGARIVVSAALLTRLNPIERAFEKIKHWMCDAQKRSVEDTWRLTVN